MAYKENIVRKDRNKHLLECFIIHLNLFNSTGKLNQQIVRKRYKTAKSFNALFLSRAPFRFLPLHSDVNHPIQMPTSQFRCLASHSESTAPFRCLPLHSDAHHPIQMPTTPFRFLPPHSDAHHPIQMPTTPFRFLPPHSDAYHPIQMSATPFRFLLPNSDAYHPIRMSPPHSKSRAAFRFYHLIQISTTQFRCLPTHSDSYHPIQMSRAPFKAYGPVHAVLVQTPFVWWLYKNNTS